MRVTTVHRVACAAALALASAATGPLAAQPRPKADVTIVTDADGVHAGRSIRAAVRVALPDGVHVQSNAPRDPLLIATTLTAAPPAGFTVREVVYPPATDFVQAGQPTPLAVFEQRFVVGVALTVAKDVAAGDVAVPVRLRYQACDATTCFAPAREEQTLTIRVVPPHVKPTARHGELFAALSFRR